MAEKVKKQEIKKYPIIRRKVLVEGYSAKIDGKYLTVDPRKEEIRVRGNKKVLVPIEDSLVYQTDFPIEIDDRGRMIGDPKPNDGEHFINLTKEQIRQLAIAGIIEPPKGKGWWKPEA